MTQPANTIATELQEKVAQLQEQLLTNHPQIPVLLRTIHTQLRKDPELVTLMTPEEIGIVVSGLKRQTNTEITTAVVKKSASTKSLKKISVDDL